MKILRLAVALLSVAIFSAACDHNSGRSSSAIIPSLPPVGSPSSPTSNGGSSPSTGKPPSSSTLAGPVNSLGGNGTYSLGGENGLDGRPAESYIRQLEKLSEFKNIIAPILRKMEIGKPDVLLVYLKWAVHHKPWYFVSVALPKLPKEQVGLIFQSDQLAVHSEEGIFIYAPTYDSKSESDRAILLVHEMVMAAKLLMKESPKRQCETLTQSGAVNLCRDDKIIASASAPTAQVTPTADHPLLDGADHETVRMMTAFLSTPNQDLSGSNVFATRLRLGFHFPWDDQISYLGFHDLLLALDRSRLAHDLFKHDSWTCMIDLPIGANRQFGDYSYLNFDQSDYSDAPSFTPEPEYTNNPESAFWAQHYSANDVWTHYQPYGYFFTSDSTDNVHSSAMLNPLDKTKIVDKILLTPSWTYGGNRDVIAEFLLTRDAAPRLLEYTVTFVNVMKKSGQDDGHLEDAEFIPITDKKPVHCVLVPPQPK